MTIKTRLLAAAGAALLTLLIAVVAVTAGGPLVAAAAREATGASATPGTSGTPGTRDARAGCVDGFGAKLAANLGVSEDQLQAAYKQTLLQQIDEAQANGRLTAEQAQRARDRVNSGDGFPCIRHGIGASGGRGHGEPGARIAGRMGLFGGSFDTAATFFGITPDQFRQDLQQQGSLQGVAAKYGKDNATDKAALKAAIEQGLRQSLTDRGLDADQVNQIVAQFSQHFDQLYTAQIGQFGGHKSGTPGDGAGRGPRRAPSATPASTQ